MSRLNRDPEKLKAWKRSAKRLKRTPFRRTGSQLSRSPLARVGKRGKRMKAKGEVGGPLCERVKKMPCLICGRSPVDPHHVRPKGAGWKDRLPNGDGNVAPLCRNHHTGSAGVHTLGPETFRARFGISLSEAAKEIGDGD